MHVMRMLSMLVQPIYIRHICNGQHIDSMSYTNVTPVAKLIVILYKQCIYWTDGATERHPDECHALL